MIYQIEERDGGRTRYPSKSMRYQELLCSDTIITEPSAHVFSQQVRSNMRNRWSVNEGKDG